MLKVAEKPDKVSVAGATSVARLHPKQWAFAGVLSLQMVGFSLIFGRLALLRYFNHEAGAMDLGYISQVFYNTAQGEPFRLTVYDPFTAPDRYSNYFFYHAEPLILLLAPFYGLFNRPEALLIFQVIALASGAIPAYWLGRDRLNSRGAGLTFAAIYLLAPSLQAAILSDYHNVALAAPLLMYAFYFGWRKKSGRFVIFALLAAMTKEDITLLVAFFGLYAFFGWRLRWAGGGVFGLALGWFLIANRLIMPYFGGSSEALLLSRYRVYGTSLFEIATTILFKPIYVWKTLPWAEIGTYLAGLWQQSGGLALFSPLVMLIGLPVLAINIFSSNGWQYSGGAHYSAALVPFLVGASVMGLGRIYDFHSIWEYRRFNWQFLTLTRRQALNIFLGLSLVVAGFYYIGNSVAPLTLNPYNPQPSAHQVRHLQRLDQFIAKIPPTATLSTQSSLVAFVSQRRTLFLYPRTMNGQEVAQFILLDVTGNPFPLDPENFQQEVKKLLQSEVYGLLAAEDGYLLFEYGKPKVNNLPTRFNSFSLAEKADLTRLRQDRTVLTPSNSEFANGEIRLLGIEVTALPEIGNSNSPLAITTYWEVLQSPTYDWQISYQFDAIEYKRVTATTAWQPATGWQPGQVMQVRDYPVFAGKYKTISIKIGRNGE